MRFTTSSGTDYSYDELNNKITIIEDKESLNCDIDILFAETNQISTLYSIDTFVIEITQQCNMRCAYCCYSGDYRNTRKHDNKWVKDEDIEGIINFISSSSKDTPLNICFYGGEPLLRMLTIIKFIETTRLRLDNRIEFSINTNGLLLKKDVVDYLVTNNISSFVSLDGCRKIHDSKRKLYSGKDSYELIYNNLSYIKKHYPTYFAKKINILITVENTDEILEIADHWEKDELFKDKFPMQIGIVSVNYTTGVEKLDEKSVALKYYKLLGKYISQPNNIVLKCFFDDYVFCVKNRKIYDLSSTYTMFTCLPNNRKCFIDANGKVGVCEKMCDNYRIGNINNGFDFVEINKMINGMSAIRKKYCSKCPIVRICDSCLLILDLNEEELLVHCHNQRIHTKNALLMLCELAEYGLL